MSNAPLFVESMERRLLLASSLVQNSAGLIATESINVAGISYFFADDGEHGQELWRSDGTAAGTQLVKDLTPGAEGTQLVDFYDLGGRLVFLTIADFPGGDAFGHYGLQDYTLWTSDGTGDGTLAIAQYLDAPMDGSANGLYAVQVGVQLALAVHRIDYDLHEDNPDSDPREVDLFFTDGTEDGTRHVRSFGATPENTQFINGLHATGDRVIFAVNEDASTVWSSDGTVAGTILLSPSFNGQLFVRPRFFDGAEKLLILMANGPTAGAPLVSTDGTSAGTSVSSLDLPAGAAESNVEASVGGQHYFVWVTSDGDRVVKTIYAMDHDTGDLTALYEIPDDGGNHQIFMYELEDQMLFLDWGSVTDALWRTDGTVAGTRKIAESEELFVLSATGVGGLGYLTVMTAGYDPGGLVLNGLIGARQSWDSVQRITQNVNEDGPARVELWRTDGTSAGTHSVRTLFNADIDNRIALYTLTGADGKIALRSEYLTMGSERLSDETIAFDPRELSVDRQGATARLVNGNLRLYGSIGNDDIRVYLRRGHPDELVVEYNGNARIFNFSDVRKITSDLQGGNDRFEILEVNGAIRRRVLVFAGDGTDTVLTGTGRDTIIGGAGGDLIRARGNADLVVGGAGRDRINAGAGDDLIGGGNGFDQIVGGSGADVLFGQTLLELAFGQEAEDEESLLEDMFLNT